MISWWTEKKAGGKFRASNAGVNEVNDKQIVISPPMAVKQKQLINGPVSAINLFLGILETWRVFRCGFGYGGSCPGQDLKDLQPYGPFQMGRFRQPGGIPADRKADRLNGTGLSPHLRPSG